MLKVHFAFINVHFKFPFTQALISTSQGKSINPRGALYAFVNCPWLMVFPRGVIQLCLVDRVVCPTVLSFVTGELLVPRLFVGCCVVFIFHCVSKIAH